MVLDEPVRKMAANVQSMCNFWKKFDLQELQRELDTTATDLANRQDESDASRKRLVDQSREFKKNTPEDIRKIVAPLLKSFQGEVDSLSKRSKASEGAFLSIYKRLIDLPDPVPVLEQALQTQKRAQRVSDLEIENKQLRETLDEYNNEFAEVKNQEVTIKQLKEKLREYEDKLETTAEARAKEKERELQRVFAEKERQRQEAQLAVARKLGEAEQKNVYLQTELENVQSELFEVKSKYDEATSAKSDEMDMVMADLERANERAASTEREVERLRQKLLTTADSVHTSVDSMRTAPDMEHALDILSRSNLQVELAAKEKEVTQLVEDVQKLQASLSKLRETSAAQVSRLEEEVALKNKALAILEEKLTSQNDYEEVKRELGVLKSMEFAGSMEGAEDSSKGRSLEVLLLEKNKTLQNENTQLKLSSASLSGTVSAQSARPASSPLRTADTAPANMIAQLVGEEMVHNYRPSSASRSSTPTSSTTACSPSHTPTSFSTRHPLTPTSVTSVGAGLDPRHFTMPPPSPFYGYPGLAASFHPSFMPVSLVKSELNPSDSLDTSCVSKMVRELLAEHNIGQRLFAKHVLGLSQGTVSELLSKPKTWDKLTEKGRESYRKMYAWASDDSKIMDLKTMLPKKSTATVTVTNPKEESVTEDRITSLLNEAQQAMHAKKATEQQHQQMTSAVMSNLFQINFAQMAAASSQLALACSSPSLLCQSSNNGGLDNPNHSGKIKKEVEKLSRSQGRGLNDSSSRELRENENEMVYRIYRQQLEDLKRSAEAAGNGGLSQNYQEDLERLEQQSQMQRDMQDLARMQHHHSRQQQALHMGAMSVKDQPHDDGGSGGGAHDETDGQDYSAGPIDLSSKAHHNHQHPQPSTPTSSSPSCSSSPVEAWTGEGPPVSSAFILAKSSVNGHDSQVESPRPLATTGISSESASPLQRMENIANSLSSRPSPGMPSGKPLRSVLPPITQEEFDGHSHINTDELVKNVKEVLSQFSISQRMFGENVLGLSQGSVSDLLARPKPWNMLTQKGREPFIRMQLFLNDTNAVPNLLSSQYRVPSDKLMRNNSRTEQGEPAPTPGDKAAIVQASASTFPLSHPSPPPPPPLPSPPSPSTLPIPPPSLLLLPASSPPDGTLPLCLPPPFTPLPQPSQQASGRQTLESGSGCDPHLCQEATVASQVQRRPQWGCLTFPPSMLEVLAMTGELDTLSLTARVRDALQSHNLGQKLFGEAVLGLSQGSVSELLSKPKPWHMLSVKGREPFLKMQLWLSNSGNIEWLRAYQSEMKVNKRKKSGPDDKGFDSQTTPKRPRVFFTDEQKDILRTAYNQENYPNQTTIDSLASQLGVGVKTIVNWFHNHRMRAKQQHHTVASSDGSTDNGSGAPKSEPTDENSNHSDMSSVSGEAGMQQAVAAAAASALKTVEASRWMFPHFESSAASSSLPCSAAEELHKESVENCLDETDGGPLIAGKGVGGDDGKRANSIACRTVSVAHPPPPPPPPAGVNKRKRSNPQRVYDGTQLDKTKLHKMATSSASASGIVSVVLERGTSEEKSGACGEVSKVSQTSIEEEAMDEGEKGGEGIDSLLIDCEENKSKLEPGLEDGAKRSVEAKRKAVSSGPDRNSIPAQGQTQAESESGSPQDKSYTVTSESAD